MTLKATGITSQEAADAMFVSKRTIDFHLANVYDKLNSRNLIAAVNSARQQGLLQD